MKPDFCVIEHQFPREDIVVVPLADLHVGAPEFDVSRWVAFKKSVLAQKNVYLAVLGDLMNNGLKSSVTNSYEETMRPREQKQWLCAEMEELAPRILCGVCGNHEARSGKDADDDPLYDVFCKLNIEDRYRQNAAFMALRFGDNRTDGSRNPVYTILCAHGAGGGMLTGGGVNRNERFGYAFDGLDILLTGHTHKPVVSAPSKIVVDLRHNQVTQKPFLCVTATGWLDYGGYALRKTLLPTSHRMQQIRLCGTRKDFRVEM